MGDSSPQGIKDVIESVEPYKRLMALVSQLYEQEIAVLTEVAEGLLQGQTGYARLDLANDTRDFNREAAQEDRDWLAYRAMAIVRDRMRK